MKKKNSLRRRARALSIILKFWEWNINRTEIVLFSNSHKSNKSYQLYCSWTSIKPSNFKRDRKRIDKRETAGPKERYRGTCRPIFQNVRRLSQFPRHAMIIAAQLRRMKTDSDTLSCGRNENYCVCNIELAFLRRHSVRYQNASSSAFRFRSEIPENIPRATRQRQPCVAYERAILRTDITGLSRNRLRGSEQNNRKCTPRCMKYRFVARVLENI